MFYSEFNNLLNDGKNEGKQHFVLSYFILFYFLFIIAYLRFGANVRSRVEGSRGSHRTQASTRIIYLQPGNGGNREVLRSCHKRNDD